MAWSPDGWTLASGSGDKTIRLWDATSGKVRRTLERHSGPVFSVAWSPDGGTLASGSFDEARLWDAASGKLLRSLIGHANWAKCVRFSTDGRVLASGSADGTVCLWNVSSGRLLRSLAWEGAWVRSISWSPNGQTLASASDDGTVCLWDGASDQPRQTLEGHTNLVYTVSWSPDGRRLVSGSGDTTIRLWDSSTERQLSVLEGHTAPVVAVCFSPDGRLLASKDSDSTVRMWRADTGGLVSVLADSSSLADSVDALAFHPTEPILAMLGERDMVIRIWRLDYAKLLGSAPKPRKTSERASHYTNAKVVLVGNSSVGKTGLGLVLAGRKFRATESTHGRHVWLFDEQQVQVKPRYASGPLIDSTRETLLWDLAGQPGYRLIHQLHLHEVAVALVLFDSRSETEPFAGVAYWARALDEAMGNFPLVKFLVAARVDRGGAAASQYRIDEMVRKYGFDGFFKTSAKRGDGMDELNQAIRRAIAWDELPNVSSTELFRAVKSFLVNEKKRGKILATEAEATAERKRQERLTVLKQREKARDFHVFLCHNSKDKPQVIEVEQTLREQGILPWFDEQRILAGDRFPKKIELAIDRAGVVAVCMSPHGLGQWQEQEYFAALSRSIEDRDDEGRPSLRLIPVLLPGVKRKPKLPVLMRTLDYIDLRKTGAAHRQQVRSLVAAILDSPRRR